jgi:hypothetical protein
MNEDFQMNRKLLVIPVLIAILFALMPMQSAHAIRYIPWEPVTTVNNNGLPRTGVIMLRLNNNIGTNITLMEVSPAGANQWVTVVNGRQENGSFTNNSFQLFRTVIYGGMNTFDFRLNGVVWKNVMLTNDTEITFGYDYEPIITQVLNTTADWK